MAEAGSGRVRVLLVLAASTGGIGRHVHSLVRGLTQEAVPVAVAAPAQTQQRFDFQAGGAVTYPVEIGDGLSPFAVARTARTLAEVMLDWQPTVVHAHGLRAGAAAVGASNRLRRQLAVPLIVTWHNLPQVDGLRGRLVLALEAISARGADLTLGASHDLVQRARQRGARDARFGAVAPPPLAEATRSRLEVRAELGVGERPLLLAVGRLAPQKDYPTLLAAALRWQTLDPSPVLAIAGDGPQAEQIRGFIDHYDLAARLLGHRTDIADLMAAADVVVLPSRWEARSLVAQEALRCGIPLVATAVGGIPELVGQAALLVPPSQPEALAAAVARVLSEPGLAAGLAAAGVVQAATWPEENEVQQTLIRLYRQWRPGDAGPIP